MAQVAYNKHKKEWEDIIFPQQGQKWGGLNKYDALSRWTIDDSQFDELVNFIPQENQIKQIPGNSTFIATTPSNSPITWMAPLPLSNATFIFCLTLDGHIYQVSTGGAITTVGSGFGQTADICSWQGTNILISDLASAKVYNWNGTTLATVFTAQPTRFVTTFAGRLWMGNGNTVTFTAAGGFSSLGGDAGSFVIGDQDTASPITAMTPFLGQLYVFGQDWIQTIGNLFDSGSPAVLQFNRYTIEDQIGPNSKWSIQTRGSFLYFANSYGFWKLVGLDPTAVDRQELNGFFQSLDPSSSFSSGFAIILGTPCLVWQVKWTVDGNNTVFIYTEDHKWCRWIGGNVTFITDAVNQATLAQTVWGTDAAGNIFTMFTNGTASVTSSFQTKLWDFGHPIVEKSGTYYAVVNVINAATSFSSTLIDENNAARGTTAESASSNLVFVNNSGQPLTFVNNSSATLIFTSNAIQHPILQGVIDGHYRNLGLNYSVTGSGTGVTHIVLQIKPTPAAFGT